MAVSSGAGDGAYDHQIKLLLIGDTAVGKTCLMLRYVDDTFSSTFITTSELAALRLRWLR